MLINSKCDSNVTFYTPCNLFFHTVHKKLESISCFLKDFLTLLNKESQIDFFKNVNVNVLNYTVEKLTF